MRNDKVINDIGLYRIKNWEYKNYKTRNCKKEEHVKGRKRHTRE